jgi:serine/threonine protein kinase
VSRCPACKTDYPEHVLVCAVDGEILTAQVHAVEVAHEDAEDFDHDETVLRRSIAVGDTVALPRPATTVQLQPSATPASLSKTALERGATKDQLPPGFKVGEYEVTSHIGSGGMATVYAGVQPVIGKKVAIKVLSRMLSSDHTMVERFVQEARAVNQIKHHNIVDIFALGELPDGRTYCVMELLVGETLKDRLRHGSPSYEETVAILSQICEGLHAAHRANVVHRDLKPDNVFLVEGGRNPIVKILDFGIAKLLDSETAPAQRTRAGILMGTPEYMSPEQCSGRDVDARADIYLLGVMMYEVFTGRLPFVATTPIMTINAHVSERPTDPKIYTDLPPKLAELILQCLAKEPAERPQTALEVRDRLVDVVTELGVDVAAALALPRRFEGATTSRQIPRTRSGVTDPNQKRARSRVPLYIGGAVVLALAAVGLFVVIKSLGGEVPPKEPAVVTPPAAPPDAPAEQPVLALQILSDPPGATVTVEGRPQALRSPYVYKVPWAERVAIRVELPGYHPNEQTVTLAKGELEKAVDVKLRAIAGPVPVEPEPPSKPTRGKGSPALITDLKLETSVAVVGEKTIVIGSVKFEDPDGDVTTLRAEVRGGKTVSTPLRMAGSKTGTATFSVVLTPSKIGAQAIEVWIQDAGDNQSNKLLGAIEVHDKPTPDKPNPDKPEKPVTDKPDPDKPSPDKPTPDKPTPDKPDHDKPEPAKPGSGSEEPADGK